MPNWIPILIVLLTQGASGSIATVHPHDMVRMIELVARWEESAAEQAAATKNYCPEADAVIPISDPAIVLTQSDRQATSFHLTSSDLTRDGPKDIS